MCKEQCKQKILLVKEFLEDVRALILSSAEFRQSRKSAEPPPTLALRSSCCLSLIVKDVECPKCFSKCKTRIHFQALGKHYHNSLIV